MRTLAPLLALLVVPTLAQSEEVWRWTDAKGTICYSNRAEAAPPEAAPVETRIIVEVSRIPDVAPDLVMDDGLVFDAHDTRPAARTRAKRMRRTHRIYSDERLHFGCYASSVLFSGGWAHPDDIAVVGNCLPYMLGPEAWLNAARAELGLREHGIDWRALVPMYLEAREPMRRERLTSVNDAG